MKIEFRQLLLNRTFTFEGINWTKTNHQRGFYYKEGKKVFRYFNKRKIVECEEY